MADRAIENAAAVVPAEERGEQIDQGDHSPQEPKTGSSALKHTEDNRRLVEKLIERVKEL